MELNYLELLAIISIVLSLGIIFANIISNKKFSLISFLFFVIVFLAHLIKYFDKNNFVKYFQDIKHIETYFLIGSAVTFLVSLIAFIYSSQKNNAEKKILLNGVFFEESRILAYITKNNKLCKYSQKLKEIFRAQKEKHNQFQLKSIKVNENKIKINNLKNALTKCNVDRVHKFEFTYANNFVLDLEITKREILNKHEKVVGYVLIDNTVITGYRVEASKEFKRYLFIYLDLLNLPLAYLDEDSGAYVLSNSLRELMKIDLNEITPYDLKDFMHPEDVFSYETRTMEDHKINQLFYRIRCGDDYLWFEENSGSFFGKKFILMRRVDNSSIVEKLNLGGYKAMVNNVNHLCENSKHFALAMLNFANIAEIVKKRSQNFSEILINKFFTKILNGPLKSIVQIFKIGATDYAIIIEGEEYLDLVIRDLSNDTSELLHQDININRSTYRLNAQIGLVLSEDFKELDSKEIIKAGLNALKEAIDPDFLKDYSIYQPSVEVVEQYDLNELGINLEEDDLSEFLEEIDNE